MRKRLLVTDNDAANRGTEALGEAQAHRVKVRTKFRQRACAGGDSFPHPGAVAVHQDVVLARKLGYALDFGEGHDHAIEGIFEADYARGAGVHVIAEDDVLLDIFEGEVDAVLGHDWLHTCTGKRRNAVGKAVS